MGEEKYRNKRTAKEKTVKEMAIINPHLAIIITCQNKWTAFSSQKTEWLNGFNKQKKSETQIYQIYAASGGLVALVIKNLSVIAGDVRDICSIPGSGRSPGGGNGNPLLYSCL